MLTAWQERFQKHFESLRRTRSASIGDKPVFALEHGLEPADLQALTADIKNHIAKAAPSDHQSLPWIVYAAELGYRYAGDEYWQTFELETTGWKKYGDRDWLRDRFRAFHKRFGGAKPSGSWAKHFSIICWPITHAILPQDLQHQLAEVLYHMRDLFSAELLTSPLALGERIAARSWNTTSRFQNFAQEPLLVGQIATALLLQGERGSDSFILPTTLRRIVKDLDRGARDRLRGAQHVAQQRIQFRGLSSRRTAAVEENRPVSFDQAREQVVALSIEPHVLLRPTNTGSWDVLLELPDFSHLLVKFPGLRDVLTTSRCIVAGSSGRPLARGALLHGPQSIILHSWPRPDQALLQFEQPVPRWFEYLLHAECLLRPGPHWLFKIGPDGLAYGLRGNLVRPNQSYVIASSRGPFNAMPGITPNSLACEGIYAARLDVPASITQQWAGYLRDLHLNQARNVRVWPAGLAATSWDGEGRGEWLTSERACIAIRPDHLIDSITLTLRNDEVQRLEVASPTNDCPIYVELPPLAIGVHLLRVSVRPTGSAVKEDAGELEIVVRESRPWSPGTSVAGALRISVDPPVPTLEQMWEGRVGMDIRGPTGREITPTISLFERRATAPSVRKCLPVLPIPAGATEWRAHFEKYFRADKQVQNHYDPAQTCLIELSADELGTFSLVCEREFSPLRWITRRKGREYELTLVDDSGSTPAPEVIMFDFAKPDFPVQIDAGKFSSGYSVPASGGLYWAYTGKYESAVIVSPVVQKPTLQELGVNSQVRRGPRSVKTLEELLVLIQLWSRARHTGLFSAARRQSVLLALLQEVFATIAGEKKTGAIPQKNASGARQASKRAITSSRQGNSLAAQLLRNHESFAALETKERVARFASLVRDTLGLRDARLVVVGQSASPVRLLRRAAGPNDPDWLCEFALRLASSPESLQTWAGSSFRGALQRLIEMPDLARVARLLVLAVDRDRQVSAAASGRQYRGWEWE
jgi:hypothetical protein